eukprot:1353378-Amphidinium_carterae.1
MMQQHDLRIPPAETTSAMSSKYHQLTIFKLYLDTQEHVAGACATTRTHAHTHARVLVANWSCSTVVAKLLAQSLPVVVLELAVPVPARCATCEAMLL